MKKNFLFEFSKGILFRIILDVIYIFILTETNPVMFNVDINIYNIILSWIVLIPILYLFTSKIYLKKKFVSDWILTLLFFFSFIPSCVYFAYSGINYTYIFLISIYWIVLISVDLILKKYYKKKIKKIRKQKVYKKYVFNIILTISFILVIYTSVQLFGKISFHLNLYDVYGLRQNFSDKGFSTWHTYMLTWIGFVIIPISASYFFYKKKYLYFFSLCLMQVMVFALGGQKSQLLFIPMGLLFDLFVIKKKKSVINYFVIISLVSIIEEMIISTNFLLDMFVRRIFFVPSVLSYYYIDFFSKNPKLLFFEDMLMSRIYVRLFDLHPLYPKPVAYIIGEIYLGKFNVSANNGMFSYEYANAGIIGVVLSAVFLVVVIHLVNRIFSQLNIGQSGVLILVLSVSILSVSSSDIFYEYIIPLLLVAYLINYSNQSNRKDKQIDDN